MLKYLFIVFCFIGISLKCDEFIIIDKEQSISDDFYASSSVIEISGVCEKDVYLIGTQVLVDGVIEGDLICLAGSLQITGVVKGAVRGIVGQTFISGTIYKNVTLASAAFVSTQDARFLSSVYLASSNVDCAGLLEGDLYVGASNIRYSANCLQNLHLYAGTVRLSSKAVVDGYVEYSSPHPIDLHQGAAIKQGLIEKKGPMKLYSRSMFFNNLIIGSKIAGALMNVIFTLLIGIILIKIWPNVFARSLNNLKNHLLKSLIQGSIFIVVVPVLGVLLLITILGIPIAVTLIAFSVLGLYTAKIHVLYFLAERLKVKRFKRVGIITLFSGMCACYFTLQLVPYLNTGLSWLFTLLGLGASIYLPKVAKKN